jgi:hypothetical protein
VAASAPSHRVPAVIYRGIKTHFILRMPHGAPLMVMRWHDARGGPVVWPTHCTSVAISRNTDRNKLVRDDA